MLLTNSGNSEMICEAKSRTTFRNEPGRIRTKHHPASEYRRSMQVDLRPLVMDVL